MAQRAAPGQVAVVDDDRAAREACALVLSRHGHTAVPFATAREAVARARAGALPRLVLMDMHLPGESAGKAIADIRAAAPDALVVALTAHHSDDYVFAALRAGAVGYVLKEHAIDELGAVLEMVERGGSPLSPRVARRLVATFRDDGARLEPLSPREQELLRLFAEGATYETAAHQLGISVDTVRTYVRRMYGKLQVTSRAQAIVAAIKRGLLGSGGR